MRYLPFFAMSILLAFQVSCNAQDSELRSVKTPIWGKDVLEKQEKAKFTYETQIRVKPPFYKGNMPMSFVNGKSYIGMNETINIYFDFGDFRNTFVYLDPGMQFAGIAEGAITTNPAGKLLAEARMVNLVSEEGNQLQGIEIEEYHYDKDGKLAFKCKSKIDFPMGLKQSESEVVGTKQRDYYFVWPVTDF